MPCPAMSGAVPMRRLKQRVRIADIGRRRHAHAADERGR